MVTCSDVSCSAGYFLVFLEVSAGMFCTRGNIATSWLMWKKESSKFIYIWGHGLSFDIRHSQWVLNGLDSYDILKTGLFIPPSTSTETPAVCLIFFASVNACIVEQSVS